MKRILIAITLLIMIGCLGVQGQTQTYKVNGGTTPTPNQRVPFQQNASEPVIYLTWGGCDWSTLTGDPYTYIQQNTGKPAERVKDEYKSNSPDVEPLDGYKQSFQGKNNPKDEHGFNWGFGPDIIYDQYGPIETYYKYSATTRLPRFNVPARGGFYKFEPCRDGQLTVYIYQNGCLNYSSSTLKTNTFSYRPVCIVDEHGEAVTLQAIETSAKVKKNHVPMSGFGNYWEPVYYDWVSPYWQNHGQNTTCKFLILNNPDLSNISITNPGSDPNRFRSVLELNFQAGVTKAENIFILDSGISKYTFNVKAGKTYFVFSLRTKSGLCGFKFEPNSTSGGTIELTESDSYTPPTGQLSNVTVVLKNRTLKAGKWQPICLPFSVSAGEVKRIFGNGTEIAHFDNTVNNRLTLKKHIYHYIIAGVPCFIKSANGFTNQDITFPHVTIESTSPEEVEESWTAERINGQDTPDYKLVGTYQNTTMSEGDYYIGTKDGNAEFFRVNPTTTNRTMKAFRCYITPVGGGGTAKALEDMDFEDPIVEEMELLESMDLMGIATNLEEVETSMEPQSTGVYNMAGQRMHDNAQLPAGIYIINGKKTIIK